MTNETKCPMCGADFVRSDDEYNCYWACGTWQKASTAEFHETCTCLRRQLARLQAIVDKAGDLLMTCSSDIFQTARVNQANINGMDLTFPDDKPCLLRIGKHFVHQAGVDASLRLREGVRELLRSIHDSSKTAEAAGDKT